MEQNKIYLGNAYELIKQMEDNSVDLIITDPPYKIEGIHASGIIKKGYDNRTQKDIVDNDLDDSIDLSILNEFVRIMKKINIYIWCNKEQIIDYLDYFVKQKGCNWEILIWAKDNPTPFCGTHYLKDKEYCLYFWEQGAKVYIPYERGKTIFISKTNTTDKKEYGHPTIKPLEIIETLIKNSIGKETENQVGGGLLIFDPFVGSGTTCVAAKRLGLNYIGFEINEKYFKIANDRINGINQKGEMNLFDL